MSVGVAQVITAAAFSTVMLTVLVAVVKFAASVGVNVTESVCAAPAFRTAPAAGVYTRVAAVAELAFSCVAPSAVPNVMSAGAGQVMTGVRFSTVMLTVLVAVVKFAASVGVNVTESVCAAPAFRTAPAAGVYTRVPAV